MIMIGAVPEPSLVRRREKVGTLAPATRQCLGPSNERPSGADYFTTGGAIRFRIRSHWLRIDFGIVKRGSSGEIRFSVCSRSARTYGIAFSPCETSTRSAAKA